MQAYPMPNELTQWAITHAKPFLQIHDPDVILVSPLDFENSWTTDTNSQRAEQAEGWTEIGKNGKKTPGTQTPQKPHYPQKVEKQTATRSSSRQKPTTVPSKLTTLMKTTKPPLPRRSLVLPAIQTTPP
jgi:hypothetical protein